MTTINWLKCYGDLVGNLPCFVRHARLTICGLATCVDGYVRLPEAEVPSTYDVVCLCPHRRFEICPLLTR